MTDEPGTPKPFFSRRRFLGLAGTGLGALALGCDGATPLSDGGTPPGDAGSGGDAGPTAEDAGLSGGTLTLDANRREGVAPFGCMFTAVAGELDVERPFHDVRYRWTFDDPGEHTRLAEDLPWGRDRDVGYGPIAAHTFERPGTYEVRCEATDGTRTARATLRVTVYDADDVYPGAQTLCVSPSGDFSGAPAGATEARTVEEVYASLNHAIPLRVLFRRGETHANVPRFNRFAGVMVGPFGDGPAPRVEIELSFRECSSHCIVWGIDMVGPYDPSDPHGTSKPTAGISFGSEAHCTVHDCELRGWNTAIRPADEGPTSVIVSNTSVRDWWNFGFLMGGGGWVGLAGFSAKQHPRTVRAPGKSEQEAPFHADHGPFRLSRPSGPVCFTLADLFTTNSWAGATTSVQQCIRWDSGGVESVQQLVLDRIRSEGGSFSLRPGSSGSRPGPRAVLVDKWHHVGTMQSASIAHFPHGGTSVRNGILVQPDTPPESTTGLRVVLGLDHENPQPGNDEVPREVYSCTIVDLRGTENATAPNGPLRDFVAYSGTEAAHRFENNVLYAPRAVTPETSDMPLDLTSRWSPIYPGRSVEGEPFDPRFATPAESTALFQPVQGSAAIGDASDGRTALDDFFGNLRGDHPSRGALEPGSTA
ncbi:MAG: PKD domain-containing protein [Sandaracinaceae bacterium]